jgi:hypothetical protein
MKTKVKPSIPVMFRGATRFYKVIGMQDNTFYGLNVTPSMCTEKVDLALVFACIGPLPDNSPFTKRSAEAYFLACAQEVPTKKCPALEVVGYRLNKYDLVAGVNLSAKEATAHLESQIPALSAWLDGIIEQAGLIPTFNDMSEVFNYFFGQTDAPEGERYELKLPALGHGGIVTPEFDYTKYGKGDKK